ncbi:MAG TPA: type I glyceraldehyde-3-phosphate dehydrogenase [Candidatus Nanoarchaeia archaeon]|nr:type I glyceraldehyde-3-phosphate dehydrogenase [Candidatus Nanoarchaeia archaeon]
MTIRVAINGFGRIGRLVFLAGRKDPAIEFVAVNDITDTATLAHLLKYDSVHGKFAGKITHTAESLVVDGKTLKVFAQKEPEKLPWKSLQIDLVVESTGIYTKKEDMLRHVTAGAKKVLLSAPPKDEGQVKVIVLGVNDDQLKKDDVLVSNASCTTNSLAPIVQVLHEAFGLKRGFMNTVHSYTSDQRLLDAPHKDLRRARAAALSIIPTTTGAAKSVGIVIPALKGKMDGVSLRVPTPDGSITDFTCELNSPVTKEEINAAVKKAADGKFKGIIEYCEDPIVSSDIVGNSHSAIFDAALTNVIDGTLVKVFSWYDNEWGFSCRMVELIKKMGA